MKNIRKGSREEQENRNSTREGEKRGAEKRSIGRGKWEEEKRRRRRGGGGPEEDKGEG